MRQVHYNGDKLFVDYSGLTIPIVNQATTEISKAQIFVCVLGASGYTFVHATPTQSTKHFIESHVQAFHFYGGVPNILVPDNLKAAVISNKKGVVKLNESYADMARHYNVAIEPARPYKPQDKSKVELGVKAVQRWILMKLRHYTFFSVDELNQQINLLLDGYNNKIVRRLKKSRTELFKLLDKPYLHPLRANQYIFKEFKRATVDVTYHDSTILSHLPDEYQRQYEKWNPRRIINRANSIGVYTTALMDSIMNKREHPAKAYRACIAILSFSKTYGNHALEGAATVALDVNNYKVAFIESMLKTKSYLLHNQSIASANNTYMNQHENIRGSEYYAQQLSKNSEVLES